MEVICRLTRRSFSCERSKSLLGYMYKAKKNDFLRQAQIGNRIVGESSRALGDLMLG